MVGSSWRFRRNTKGQSMEWSLPVHSSCNQTSFKLPPDHPGEQPLKAALIKLYLISLQILLFPWAPQHPATSSTLKPVLLFAGNDIFLESCCLLALLGWACRWSWGRGIGGRVRCRFGNPAADLEPAGRPRPCGKSSDAELVSRGREEEQHSHPSISPVGLIWEQIGGGADGNCVSTARWSLPGAAPELAGTVQTCGTCSVWVLSEPFPAGSRQVWTAQEGREQGPGSSCRFKFNQQVFCTFGLFYVL